MSAALSELSVTEFITLARVGFHPAGLVIGSSVYAAGSPFDWVVATGEVKPLSHAMREARHLAIADLREQAKRLGADGVVLRFGYWYGPGTWIHDRTPPPPRVHIDAAAEQTVAALAYPSGVYTITDAET